MSDELPISPFLNGEELLYRQVHPTLIKDGQISSSNFIPKPKDKGKLSVDRSSMTTPKVSYAHYTEVLNLQSDGIWAVSVNEGRALQLSPEHAPLMDNPAHSQIDFTAFGKKEIETKAKILKAKANARQRIFPP